MSHKPSGSSWRAVLEGAFEAMGLSDEELDQLMGATSAGLEPTDLHGQPRPDLGPVTPAERAGLRAAGRLTWRSLRNEEGQEGLARLRASCASASFAEELDYLVARSGHTDLIDLGLGSSGGRSLLGRFHVREELGPLEAGGRRYRAEERPSGAPVEVWVARHGVVSDPARLADLEAWLAHTASLDGPGVLAPREVLRAPGGRLAVVLDAPGRSLEEVCRSGEPLALRVAAARGLLRAAPALARGDRLVPHLFSDARILADGAVAVSLRPRVKPTESEERRLGPRDDEPQHMSPERILGKRSSARPRSDVYEVASVLFHLLEGRPPYQAPSVFHLVSRKARHPPDPPVNLSPALQAVLLRGMAVDPTGRFADLDELVAAFERSV